MRGSFIAGSWKQGFSTIYMGKPVASRFGQMVRRIQDWLILIPFSNRVHHIPKSVSFNEKRPRKPETNIQLKVWRHEIRTSARKFPTTKIGDCLFRHSVCFRNRPLALRGHVTNTSLKQLVGILLMPKIDRAHKNYLTPEIWEEKHLREIFYGTLIFQQSSMICIFRHVGGHTLALQHGGQNYFLLSSC